MRLALAIVLLALGSARADWRVIRDPDTHVARWMWGAHVAAPGSSADPVAAERAARAFLSAHLDELAPGARAADFIVVSNQVDGALRTVGFVQTWSGLRVHGGAVGFVFSHDLLFAITSSAWPRVDAVKLRGAQEIIPRVRAGAITYQAAKVVEVQGGRVYIAADSTELLREHDAMDASATLQYNVGKRYATGERTNVAAGSVAIAVNGAPTITSSTGAFSWGTTIAATVVPSVDGTTVKVINRAGANATASLVAQPSQAVIWDRSGDELEDAQLSAYIYVMAAKARARAINPSVVAWLDSQLPVYVNETAACNATGSKTEMHFERQSSECENTARVADIVFHEFGHTLHFNSVITGVGAAESHLSEGLADFFAANITEDPSVGRGLSFDDAPLRDIDPAGTERLFPVDYYELQPHLSGLIISGALWDLRKALIRELGRSAGLARTERIFGGILQRASDISTAYVAALIADDDDADLGNLTPNYCTIEREFFRHGLVPDAITTRVGPPIVDELSISVPVTTPSNAPCSPPVVTQITVTWHAGDGVPSTFDLGPGDGPWTGTFPVQPDGTVVSYSVDVVFDDGAVQTFPDNPADPSYQVFIGGAAPIMCQSFNDNPQWEQASNLGFEWEWAAPPSSWFHGDPQAAHTATNVLGTDVTVDGLYRSDLDVGVYSPVIDVSAYEHVHLQYWRWLTIEDARYDQATISANNTEIWRNASLAHGSLVHIDHEWRFQDLDLTPYIVDGSVQLRWGLRSDYANELGGWSLDDVCVIGAVQISRCGDAIVGDGEQCDDGNRTLGDGCDNTCHFEISAGGGGCCDAGSDPAGHVIALVWVALVWRRRRGRRRATYT